MIEFDVVVPARYASTRLPGKALLDINGKPMVQHVYDRAIESGAASVIIATDDKRIADVAEAFGAFVCMTDEQHISGTERIAEVADIMDWPDSKVVVNLQGDEPNMPAELISECAQLLDVETADIATLASPFLSDADFQNPNCVKVVRKDDGNAMYFSRAAIPYARAAEAEIAAREHALHHHGIYAYRCGVLRQLVQAEASALELVEQLEQLRALSLGLAIRVGIPSCRPSTGVDTDDDLAHMREILN